MSPQALIETWRHDPYYGHGYMVFLICLAFLFAAILKIKNHQGSSSPLSFFSYVPALAILFVLQLLIYFSGGMLAGYLQVLSVLLLIKILTMWLWGKDSKYFNFPLLFFIFAVPLPYLDKILFVLQSSAAWFVAFSLNTLGVEVLREGLLISFPDWQFVVGSSCSGFNGSVVLMSLVFLLTKILNWPGKKQVFLLLWVFPIAFVANVMRILFLVFIGQWKGSESAFAYWHDFGALTFYLLALGAVTWVTYKINAGMRYEKTPV